MNPLKFKLHWQILVALALAVLLAMIVKLGGWQDAAFGAGVSAFCSFMGRLFMNALNMIVVPLIVSTVICGILAIGSERDFGRLGTKTLVYYTVTGIVAVITGLLFVNLIGPGRVSPELANQIIGQGQNPEVIMERVAGRDTGDLVDIFLRMVPPNIIEAATDNGQLLGLITVSLLVGFFISKLPDKHRETMTAFWESAQALMMRITDFVIAFAPLGVLGLVTPVFIRTGNEIIGLLSWFFLTVVCALAFHFFVNLGLLMRFVGRFNPVKHYVAMTPVLLTAFSTASSSGTLPVTLDTVRDAGVSTRVSSFTLPLGATVNMDGTALYECVVVIFIAQIYSVVSGVEFGLMQQFTVVLLAVLTSIGVAGIPAASLVAITVILGAVKLPVEAVGIVWATDRILDMCRTSVNVFSDTCGAAIIARSEGESSVYADPAH